jgi:hypothetical protein
MGPEPIMLDHHRGKVCEISAIHSSTLQIPNRVANLTQKVLLILTQMSTLSTITFPISQKVEQTTYIDIMSIFRMIHYISTFIKKKCHKTAQQ